VLYAALAPCSATAGVLYAVCRRWEDHLWARTAVLLEERRSAVLGALGGFWERGVPALDAGAGTGGIDETDETDEEAWEEDVREALQDMANVSVREG
jgi:hypothetical protein